MARFEFTMVSDAMMQGLLEARATGAEIVAYQMLVRGLPKDRRSTECWMPADMAEVKVGMRADVFTRALNGLCRKTITLADGARVPVLTKVSRGCRGHCPHYDDTLGAAIAEGSYPPGIARQDSHAIEGRNARQKQGPIAEFSTSKCKAKTGQLQGKVDPIARQGCLPIETRLDKQFLVGGAVPHAQRSAAVRSTDLKDETASRVVTGTDPRAAAEAGRGRPAAALPTREEPTPTREEYLRVARILEEQGLDALTEQDRETYHAGHAAWAATA